MELHTNDPNALKWVPTPPLQHLRPHLHPPFSLLPLSQSWSILSVSPERSADADALELHQVVHPFDPG